MELRGEDFNQLFRDFTQSAFHLEMQDVYTIAEEVEPLRRWRVGEPDDYEWVREWHELIKAATAVGKSVVRARVITEPVTEYVRFEHAMARFNIAAGEQLFWVPRSRTSGIDFPQHDFWLFDDNTVAFNVFSADGSEFGSRLATDPATVEQCLHVRDQVLAAGVRHEDFHLH
jgi:hypothetical protein